MVIVGEKRLLRLTTSAPDNDRYAPASFESGQGHRVRGARAGSSVALNVTSRLRDVGPRR